MADNTGLPKRVRVIGSPFDPSKQLILVHIGKDCLTSAQYERMKALRGAAHMTYAGAHLNVWTARYNDESLGNVVALAEVAESNLANAKFVSCKADEAKAAGKDGGKAPARKPTNSGDLLKALGLQRI